MAGLFGEYWRFLFFLIARLLSFVSIFNIVGNV